jgi:hypothetical protein
MHGLAFAALLGGLDLSRGSLVTELLGFNLGIELTQLIVVALVMGEEATLKRLRRKGASIALEAANPAYETRIFGPDQVAVQGKLVGLIRAYH